jgi:hypothetical protein
MLENYDIACDLVLGFHWDRWNGAPTLLRAKQKHPSPDSVPRSIPHSNLRPKAKARERDQPRKKRFSSAILYPRGVGGGSPEIGPFAYSDKSGQLF